MECVAAFSCKLQLGFEDRINAIQIVTPGEFFDKSFEVCISLTTNRLNHNGYKSA